MLEAVWQELDRNADASVARLTDYLRIPCISSSPDHTGDMLTAAQFTAAALREAGLDVRIEKTTGHPLVRAHAPRELIATPDAPHVVFYGHYDVQPADPLDLWTTAPFEPTIRNGAIYARGASDDKGQVHAFLEALRAWRSAAGKFPGPLTVLIEGEEEVGSAGLMDYLKKHKADFPTDPARSVVLVSDTHMFDRTTPAIIHGLRGLLYFDVQLFNAQRDTHSGMYGGTYANPATVLTQILGQLFDDEQRVTIPGFYDDVAPPTEAELARWKKLGFDEQAFLAEIGVNEPFGEADCDTLTRRWARPSCDINGLYGGYGGPGSKTIIPAFAGAKVSFRLAANQKSKRIAKQFEHWLQSFDTHGCAWKIISYTACDPVLLPTDSPWITKAAQAITHTSGKPPVLTRDGATIPIVASFKNILGLDTLLVGFGLSDDNLHAPNEKFDLANYHLARRTHAALLAELAK